jgi:hypothetical protein
VKVDTVFWLQPQRLWRRGGGGDLVGRFAGRVRQG